MFTLKVCGDKMHSPIDFIDAHGNADGFNTCITRTVAKEIGIDVDINLMDWSDAVDAFDRREYDAIQSMSISKARLDKYTFCEEYITAFHCIFALNDRYDLDNDMDYTTFSIAVQSNDIGYKLVNDQLDGKPNDRIIVVNSQEDALKLLISGVVDIIVGNKLIVSYAVKHLGVEGLIRQVGKPLSITKYSIAFHKNNGEIAALFNQGLEEIKRNGAYERIYSRWFGKKSTFLERTLIENVNIGVIFINSLGRVSSINNFATVILESSPSEVLYQVVYETKIIDYFDIDIIQEILDGRKASYSGKINVEKNNGDLILLVNYSQLLFENQELMGVIINFEDITEKEKKTRYLEQKNRLESIGMMLLNIAHEVRNPLTSIKNFIELLPENYDDPEFRESIIYHVSKQIEYINSLLSELLEYSKPKKASIVTVNFRELIEIELKSGIYNIAKINKNVDIQFKIPENFCLDVDAHQFKQILINVVLNALEAAIDDSSVIIEASETQTQKFISVKNKGVRVPEKIVSTLFDPFVTTKANGTGLGLFICYQLIEANRGRIEFKNLTDGVEVNMIFNKE